MKNIKVPFVDNSTEEIIKTFLKRHEEYRHVEYFDKFAEIMPKIARKIWVKEDVALVEMEYKPLSEHDKKYYGNWPREYFIVCRKKENPNFWEVHHVYQGSCFLQSVEIENGDGAVIIIIKIYGYRVEDHDEEIGYRWDFKKRELEICIPRHPVASN